MKTLIVNSGSSSIKYQLIDVTSFDVLQSGEAAQIGFPGSYIRSKSKTRMKHINVALPDHEAGIRMVLSGLLDPDIGVIKSLDEIGAVGHRIVHGGKYFDGPAIVDDDVLDKIKKLIKLAPLHNDAAAKGIEACMHQMQGIPQVVSFDTAFHMTIPPEHHTYALPYEYYTDYDVRKYGFHGISHDYVSRRVAALMGRRRESMRIVSCHLGNGGSICAIKKGKSFDTSMGFTPLDGIMMGTRCGSIDPAIIPFIMEEKDLTPQEMDAILNRESGLLGVSGISNDIREIDEARYSGNYRADLALKMYAESVRRYIGAFAFEMGGCDALTITAGIGQNSAMMRRMILEHMEGFGIVCDWEANANVGAKDCAISTEGSPIQVYVIHTNEEYIIAKDCERLCAKPEEIAFDKDPLKEPAKDFDTSKGIPFIEE
ncbi:MAG: acetate kinase [bacterium]|nr:acetate kinase [bacterium]